jgi:archaemetzincin
MAGPEPQPNPGRTAAPIELVPVGPVDPTILDALRPELGRRFDTVVRTGVSVPLRPEWCDPTRGQYRADPILDLLVEREDGAHWILGIADVDLFAPGLNFIFGQATVGGCCAIIGLARLRPEFHGHSPDPDLFRRRTLTEAVHELGHIAGLKHCPNPECVMHFSHTLEDTDRKGPDFCDRCSP